MITLRVNKAAMECTGRELLTSGAQKAYLCSFQFSGDWEGVDRTAVFRGSGEQVSQVLTEDDQCLVPWEVLAVAGSTVEVGVYGTQEDGRILPTVWAELGRVREGAVSADAAQEPTQTVYSQILALAAAAEESASEALALAQSVQTDAESGAFDGMSAYAYAVQGGYTGTEAEFAARMAQLAASGGMTDTVEVWDQMNDSVAEYVESAQSAYTESNYSTVSVVSDYLDGERHDDPVGYGLTIQEAGTLYLVDETDTAGSFSEAVTAGSYTVYDLIPGHVYRWYIVNASGETTQNGKLQATGMVRMIYFDGLDNCRDIGGRDCAAGTVKYGVLYRGIAPTEAMADTLTRVCKIKSDIDLRTDDGASYATASAIGDDIEYNRYPMTDADYRQNVHLTSYTYYKSTASAVAKAMENACLGVPTYIHCTAGADRTRVVCWILSALLGVSEPDCDIDGELTNFCLSYTGRVRTSTGWVSLVNYMTGFGQDSFLENILYWCARAGLTAKQINRYRRAMCSGTPEDISFQNTVAYDLTNVTSGNSAASVASGDSYTTTLTVEGILTAITVAMNGVDVTQEVWDADSGTITIGEVTGDITITAAAAVNTVSVTADLSNVTMNGNTYAEIGSSYSASLTAEKYYSLSQVTVTMNGVDVTASAASGGVIAIDSVTGAIVITATAVQNFTNVLETLECTGGYRVNSSGELTAVDETSAGPYMVTGFIPYTPGTTVVRTNLPLTSDCGLELSSYGDGGYVSMSFASQAGDALSGYCSRANGFPTLFTDYALNDGIYTWKMESNENLGSTTQIRLTTAPYFRICCILPTGYAPSDFILTLDEEIL